MLEFVSANIEEIKREIVAKAEKEFGDTLFPGDEKYMMLMVLAFVVFSERNKINAACNSNLLEFSFDKHLDALALFRSNQLTRLPAQNALVTMEFTLSAAQTSPVRVPKGTRVSPDGQLFFATTTELIIPSGGTSGTALAEATESGNAHNGFVVGQIRIIVDPVMFVGSAVNIDTSTGGADIESDDAFSRRILISPEGFSSAGPEGAYRFWAMTADSNIIDAITDSPAPGVVNVIVLLRDNMELTQPIKDKVYTTVYPHRPTTDNVFVVEPTSVEFDINLTYYILPEQQTRETAIREAVENAVNEYIGWQTTTMDRDILPEALIAAVKQAGAYRVIVTAPEFTEISRSEVAKIGSKTVMYGGLFT